MPQGSRTHYQRTVFRWMLKNVNALFLGGSILIVMDSAYLSKFWTQFEAWLGMQRCTLQGLKPASKATRWVAWSIHSATSVAELEQRWMNKSRQEAEALLSKPDCVVTNMSDKTIQLKKLATLDQDVQRSWASIVRLCRETHDATKLLRAGLGREELAELGVFVGPDTEDFPTMRCVRNLMVPSHAVRCLALSSTTAGCFASPFFGRHRQVHKALGCPVWRVQAYHQGTQRLGQASHWLHQPLSGRTTGGVAFAEERQLGHLGGEFRGERF